MAPQSILIVGAGIAGPVLATFLLIQPNLSPFQLPSITIVERSSSLRAQGQNIDIRGLGVPIIRMLGLERAIRASTTREEGVHMVDSQNRVWAEIPADKSGKYQTATSDIEILRGTLAGLCYERCKATSDEVKAKGGKGVEFVFGDELGSLDQDGDRVNVSFKRSGDKESFDLVVGADGLLSQTRKLAFGEEGEDERMKGIGMYGAFFSLPKTETDSLWRRFYTVPRRRGIMVRPHERDDLVTAFMAVFDQDKDPRFREVGVSGRKGVADQKALMAEYFQGTGWETDRLIREMNASEDFYYSIVAQIKMERWSKGRVVLLGDAGYCASPISGMGTTLAFTGAYTLAGALTHHQDDYTAAFAEYQQTMRPLVDKAQELPLGGRAPYIMYPETAWGIVGFRIFALVISYVAPVVKLLLPFAGPPANAITVEDYGFPTLPDLMR